VLFVDKVTDVSNLGSLIRSASAFGVCAVVLSRDSCDPYYRKSVRASMGHVFRVPVIRVEELGRTIQKIKEE
jgi:tRNA G18 (ribose-2'-O)-methylase SpoU